MTFQADELSAMLVESGLAKMAEVLGGLAFVILLIVVAVYGFRAMPL